MSNAMDGNGILGFLDRDLKAPQPALTKGRHGLEGQAQPEDPLPR